MTVAIVYQTIYNAAVAVIVSISKEGLDQNELHEINYLVSSVRAHAMAYDEDLSQYDREEIDKV